MPENTDSSGKFELRQFEKNRFFQGKLMTARDMFDEQQYHSSRLETISRFVLGTGIVWGLEVSEVTRDNEELRVTIDPGVAIDPRGRPIVVSNPTTRTLPIPEGEAVYLYIEYSSELKDPVPVPGSDPAGRQESEESRILEAFTLTAKEIPPSSTDAIQQIELPEFERSHRSLDEFAKEIANTYHEANRTDLDDRADTSVFLGSCTRTVSGDWELSEETIDRSIVYDTDMLFSLLLSHISDTTDPHSVTEMGESGMGTDGLVGTELDQLQHLGTRVEEMESEMGQLESRLEIHVDYIVHKSLRSSARLFDVLANKFEQQSSVSQESLAIVNRIDKELEKEIEIDRESYLALVDDLLFTMRTLVENLETKATNRSQTRLRKAVEELDHLTNDQPKPIEVATALDKVGEAAEMIEIRHTVVPEDDQ